MTIKEQLIALRDLTKGSTYDVSSSNYRFLPEVVQDYFYTNEFGEKGAESYVSKVNRYINREISPLTEEEKEESEEHSDRSDKGHHINAARAVSFPISW